MTALRDDLPWLRRVSAPAPAAAPSDSSTQADAISKPTAPPPATAAPIDTRHHDVPAPTSDGSALDLSAPSAPIDTRHHSTSAPAPSGSSASSLDLSGPTAPTTRATPAPSAESSSLDLSAPIDTRHHRSPAPEPARPRIDAVHHDVPGENPSGAGTSGGSGLLDLSPRTTAPVPPPRRVQRREQPRVRTGEPPRLLTPDRPTVTLTRLQAGVGALRIELVASAAVGDARLGVAYELADRRSSLLLEGGRFDAGPDSRRPVLRLVRSEYAALEIDLRQNRSLRRLLVLGVSASGQPLHWGGTVVITTQAGARAEAPIDLGDHTGPAALLTHHVVDGEHVLRAEADPLDGSVRDVCLAYGYDRITWADDRTPAG